MILPGLRRSRRSHDVSGAAAYAFPVRTHASTRLRMSMAASTPAAMKARPARTMKTVNPDLVMILPFINVPNDPLTIMVKDVADITVPR